MRTSVAALSSFLLAAAVLAAVPTTSVATGKAYRHPDFALIQPLDAIGRLASLIPGEPLIPGAGDDNALEWEDADRPDTDVALGSVVWSRVREYLERHAAILHVDVDGLSPPRIGIVKRDAVINHGHLVLLGLESWCDAPLAGNPRITSQQLKYIPAVAGR